MKCVLIGAGSRGMLYARWAKEHGGVGELARSDELRRQLVQQAADR